MLIQGSNNPLTIQFSEPVEDLPRLVVTLWLDRSARISRMIKQWEKEDMMVSGDTVVCQLTEEETRALSPNTHVVEAKGLDEHGNTVFWAEYKIDVLNRRDKVILLTQGG